jgi:Ca2+-binding EF-hand superfamily protein
MDLSLLWADVEVFIPHRAPSRGQPPKEMNTDLIEKMIREKVSAGNLDTHRSSNEFAQKIEKNLKNVIKALRLYDYNRDSHIQRHELRKVLESYCFRMSDNQFDKYGGSHL